MGENSAIAWTTHTFNAWEGCEKVSQGCKNCYAESRNSRYHAGQHWGPMATTERLLRSPAYWNQPKKWNRAALESGTRPRVFSASLSDVFEDHPDVAASRAKLFRTVAECLGLDWLLLTKRPENIMRLVPENWRTALPANVWIGTTAEDEPSLCARLDHLLAVPARVRFLSVEPMLERIDFDPPFCDLCGDFDFERFTYEDGTVVCARHEHEAGYHAVLDPCADEEDGINWVILGGESGPRARPCAHEWLEEAIADCRNAGVPVFMKQLGEFFVSESRVGTADMWDDDNRPPEVPGSPGEHWGWRAGLKDKKGGDPAEWPESFRVRMSPGEKWAPLPERESDPDSCF